MERAEDSIEYPEWDEDNKSDCGTHDSWNEFFPAQPVLEKRLSGSMHSTTKLQPKLNYTSKYLKSKPRIKPAVSIVSLDIPELTPKNKNMQNVAQRIIHSKFIF